MKGMEREGWNSFNNGQVEAYFEKALYLAVFRDFLVHV